jgi:transposase-like protein
MICPRCESEHVEKIADSPVGNVWEVYMCERCYYSWRSTEAPEVTDPAKYNPKFKLTEKTISTMMEIPPIPPLKTR